MRRKKEKKRIYRITDDRDKDIKLVIRNFIKEDIHEIVIKIFEKYGFYWRNK